MTEDRIERDTLIAAPMERVWSFVVEPAFWVDHQGTLAGTELHEGMTVVAKNETYGDFPVSVERIDPPRYAAFRWASAFPGEPLTEKNATLIEFTLTPEGDGTRLRVVESGFAGLAGTDELRRQAHRDNTGGWGEELEKLRERVEKQGA